MSFTMIMLDILRFWLVVQVFHLLALPIAYTLFKNLPGRGYALARPLGLLLSTYILWLGGSFGFLSNNAGGTVFAMLLVLLIGWIWYRQNGGGLLPWLRQNLSYILWVELLFGLAFVGWTFFKAYNPDIMTAGGEKWMEIAFINSALLSPNFPPQDPWLSGFGISYYYFGYVMMSILIRFSGIVSTTAFNLLVPLLFALTLSVAFSLVSDLLSLHRHPVLLDTRAKLYGLLGAMFVGLLGHWHGLLEMLYARGLLPDAFWAWLDIRDLQGPPLDTGSWIPSRYNWWWRGSRVLTDRNLAGQEQEVIDEMPFFSFMLADVHPHVLALPFVLLTLALALNLLFNAKKMQHAFDFSAVGSSLKHAYFDLLHACGGPLYFALYLISFGALGFLNTWDLPIYLAILGIVYWAWRRDVSWLEPVLGMIFFAILAVFIYFPFYLSFQSQAGGILPNLWNPTRFPQFVVFFGPFLIMLLGFLGVLSGRWSLWRKNLIWLLPLTLGGPILLLSLLGLLAFTVGQEYLNGILNNPAVQTALGANQISDLLPEILARRLGNPWTFVFLALSLAFSGAHAWAWLQTKVPADNAESSQTDLTIGRVELFVLALMVVGFLLPLSLEFIFLRDLFQIRMNTIFKFYFQTWVLFALASAFALYYVNQALRGTLAIIWQACVTLAILAALLYPALAIWDKTNKFAGPPTLDGMAWVERSSPDDHAAILWLRENAPPNAVIIEAPGDSYRFDNRVSALTGRATLLGWRFHQSQWRGNYDEPGRREPDITAIYNETDPGRTLTLLDKYDITYVYIGPLERQQYNPAGLAKFENFMNLAFTQGEVLIYERPRSVTN